jgi:ubiquinone/menaquinone biosynthesis C-methylase UbiE
MSNVREETRNMYKKLHERIAGNKDLLKTMKDITGKNTFGVDLDWFKGKKVLDGGCGNVGQTIMRLVELGVDHVTGIDIGSEWKAPLQKSLESNKIPSSKFTLKTGSITDIPFEDKTFDFVCIHGVMTVLKDIQEVIRAFGEGARVCKPGGYYFTSYGCSGGLIQGVIFPAIRKHYVENEEFKKYIDNITTEQLHKDIDKICADAKKYTGEDYNAKFLKTLFGDYFCAFLQNYIQPPTWLSNETTPALIEQLYKQNGFGKVVRLNNFVKRNDVRKYFSPLHYDWDYPLSRILYGEGYVTYVGQKV